MIHIISTLVIILALLPLAALGLEVALAGSIFIIGSGLVITLVFLLFHDTHMIGQLIFSPVTGYIILGFVAFIGVVSIAEWSYRIVKADSKRKQLMQQYRPISHPH